MVRCIEIGIVEYRSLRIVSHIRDGVLRGVRDDAGDDGRREGNQEIGVKTEQTKQEYRQGEVGCPEYCCFPGFPRSLPIGHAMFSM